MKRSAFLLLLVLISPAAFARWELLARNEDIRVLVDRDDIRRQGDHAVVWQLLDYTSARWVGIQVYMSVRNLVEVDCAGRRARTVAATAYTEPMGRGQAVFSEKAPAPEWNAIPEGGSAELVWKIACGYE